MNLIVNPRTLSGTIAVPGSKSHTIRAVALAMMADGVSRIHAPLVSADTLAAVRAAKALGKFLLTAFILKQKTGRRRPDHSL